MSGRTEARDAALAAALGLVAFAIYLPALRLEFAADDFLILDNLEKLGGLRNAAAYFEVNFYGYYRPLVFLSYALDAAVWGVDAAGFHLTNVALHGVNTMLVYALARRVAEPAVAGGAALLFALHPTNAEGVFWVSGRFDLLATAWILAALVFLWRPGLKTRPPSFFGPAYWLGAVCFALALLSKESAATVVILAPAFGVLIEGRDWRWALGRQAPFFVISAAYVLARDAAGLAAVGGPQRIGKLLMLLAAVGVVLWLARTGQADRSTGLRRRLAAGVATAAIVALVLGALVTSVPVRDQIGPSLGFATYAMYSLGPFVLWPVWPVFLDPNSLAWIKGGVAGVALAAGLVAAGWSWLRARPSLFLAALIVVASLVPVSAMPGPTHLYLASTGAALFAALALALVPKPMVRTSLAFALLVLMGANLAVVTARWQRASAMTRGAVALVTSHPMPCADREVVLLTAPSGVDGVPCNLNYETFRILGDCVPRALHAVLRVTREDAAVEVSRPASGIFELRVRDYRGNIMASEDLRNYRVQVRDDGRKTTLETPLGRLETWPDGSAQMFRLTMTADASRATFYYYSRRQVHAVPR
jgi:hypothetical protein